MDMKKLAGLWPFFLLLLPLFFVFHGYVENYGLIGWKDSFLLFLVYALVSLAVFFLFFIALRNRIKAALAAFVLMFFYFFFGYFYDSIWSVAPHSFFSKYSVILGGMLLIALASITWLFLTKKKLYGIQTALNIFFLFLLLVEAGFFVSKLAFTKTTKEKSFHQRYTICETCDKPDVYLILTDGYPGDKELKDLLSFDNTSFKNELRKRGFHCPATVSNYNYTPFSIGSMFNMEYLPGIKGIDTDPGDLAICFGAMKEAKFLQVIEAHGYRMYNYSLFDIYKEPSPFHESVLPARTKFITAQTLFNRVERNMLYNNNTLFKSLQKRRMYISYNNIIKAYGSTLNIIRDTSASPKFIYSHLEMPHYPYYFDRNGKPFSEENLREGKERDTTLFKEYLLYTNNQLLRLVDSIQLNNKRPAVIMLVSDHGYRELPFRYPLSYEFNNSVAIYLPNQAYGQFYEGISNINIMRSFLNAQLAQKFPMLNDSTIKIVIK